MSLYNIMRQMIPKRGHGREHDGDNPKDWGSYILFPGSNVLLQWGGSEVATFDSEETEDINRMITFSRNFVTSSQYKVALGVTTSMDATPPTPNLTVTCSVIAKGPNSITVRIHRVSGLGSCFVSAIAVGVDKDDPTANWNE